MEASARQGLVAAWQRRLTRARDRYEQKSAVSRALLLERIALPANAGSDPDGTFAILSAIQRESEAMKEYVRVLKIASGILMGRAAPDEEP